MSRRGGMGDPAWHEAWRSLEADDVDPGLLELAEHHLAGELSSSDVLAARLTGVVTFAGALLAVGVTLSANAAKARLHDDARTVFSILMVAAIAILVAAIARALIAMRPRHRVLPNPALLRHYADRGTPMTEVRADTFKLYGAGLETTGRRNAGSARPVRDSLALVAVALVLAAAGALTMYFDTPWPTIQNSSKALPRTSPPLP
jgi:hypothetical protein